MPRPLPLVPTTTPDAEVVAPLILDMDARDLFADTQNPARWTLDLLRKRTTGTLTRSQACAAQRHILTFLPIVNLNDAWAILAATDTLGRIDTHQLTEICLAELLRDAAALHIRTFAHFYQTQAEMLITVNAMKISAAAHCPGSGSVYGVFLDRVAQALFKYLV